MSATPPPSAPQTPLSYEQAGVNYELIDPLKTTVVQDQRSMTTWVLRKLER